MKNILGRRSIAWLPVFILKLIVLVVFVSAPQQLIAMQASPFSYNAIQPDGSVVKLHIRGDENFHWEEDMEGYTVVRDKGWMVYARLNKNKELSPGIHRVGKMKPNKVGLKRRILPPPEVIRAQDPFKNNRSNAGIQLAPSLSTSTTLAPRVVNNAPAEALSLIMPTVTVTNLVVLMRFSDHVTRPLPSDSDYDVLFNSIGGDPLLAPSGSVRDYYNVNSYGQFNLVSTVTVWVDLPNTEAYYADGESGLVGKVGEALIYALNEVDALIDFSDFDSDSDGVIDAITFMHSGYAAEFGGSDVYGTPQANRIWSHKSAIPTWTSSESVKVSKYSINSGVWSTSGSAIGRIGVIAHEAAHFFGLPDLYDTSFVGFGIGSYGLMSNSWGFDNSQYYPPHLSPWSKIKLGWITPTILSSNGTYSINQAETNAEVFRIDSGFPDDEYLLVENRQPSQFDSKLPQGGLVIWHIDDKIPENNNTGYPGQTDWPGNGRHYKVALLQADSNYDMERKINRGDGGDVYHGLGVSAINSTTLPSTDTYQNGNIMSSGNTISSISISSATMTFDYFCGDSDRDTDGDCFFDDKDAFPFDPTEWLDTDGDGIGNNTDTDDDGDSMPDIWEIDNNLDPLNFADADIDTDTDGFVNFFEYIKNTDPQNNASQPTIIVSNLRESFENGKPLQWRNLPSAEAGWSVNSSNVTDGAWSLKSDSITHNESAAVEFIELFDEGMFEFDYHVSSEPNFDSLQVYLDNVLMLFVTGDQTSSQTLSLTKGLHSIRFVYAKDITADVFSDAAWIDNIRFFNLLDLDGDGVPNLDDAFPNDPSEWEDSDNDTVGDNSDNCPLDSNPDQANFDGDANGDICDDDDDNDLIPDNVELNYGLNTLDPSDAALDLDTDKLSNLEEFQIGTLLDVADSDSDGGSDYDEYKQGTDPLDENDYLASTLIKLNEGFNLVSIPTSTAFNSSLNDWLPLFGTATEIEKVQYYDKVAELYSTLLPEDNGNVIVNRESGEAIVVYALVAKDITFSSIRCTSQQLQKGLNVIGFACGNYITAFQLLNALGEANVASVQRYSSELGRFESAVYNSNSLPGGVDFPIAPGIGYFVHMKQALVLP